MRKVGLLLAVFGWASTAVFSLLFGTLAFLPALLASMLPGPETVPLAVIGVGAALSGVPLLCMTMAVGAWGSLLVHQHPKRPSAPEPAAEDLAPTRRPSARRRKLTAAQALLFGLSFAVIAASIAYVGYVAWTHR